MKKPIIALIIAGIIILLGVGAYVWKPSLFTSEMAVNNQNGTSDTNAQVRPTEGKPAEVTPVVAQENKAETVIGTSVEGRSITAYHFGKEDTQAGKELLFIGGAHGGYEWNTVLVAYQLVDYLKTNPDAIPAGVRVTVIPVLNPDGLYKVVGTGDRFTAADVPASPEKVVSGRYNANNVDLNRNFDCDWQSTGMWQNTKVSGGSAAFSEPESKALQTYVGAHKPSAVVVWFSSAGGVFSSSCHNGVSSETSAITKIYADASGYPAFKEFNFYEITGDMVNWFAKNNIPAVSVLLSTHNDIEWSKNHAGILALFKHYSK